MEVHLTKKWNNLLASKENIRRKNVKVNKKKTKGEMG